MTASFDIAGHRIWITGAGGGIGRAVAEAAAAAGAIVIATDLDRAASEAVISGLEGEGHRAAGLDVTDAAATDAFLRSLDQAPHALVHCAAVGVEATVMEARPEDFDRIFRINVTGTFIAAMAAVRAMRGGGAIVTFASTAGHFGSVRRAAYGASKAAVIALSKTMAAELCPMGIRVNVVSPGPVRTELVERMHGAETKAAFAARVPMGRYGEPAEIAGAALFLVGPAASFITGHVLTVDGGFTAVPMMIGTQGGART